MYFIGRSVLINFKPDTRHDVVILFRQLLNIVLDLDICIIAFDTRLKCIVINL